MTYEFNPVPDEVSLVAIVNDHILVEVNIAYIDSSDALRKVRLDQYRTLIRDLNRKAEQVRRLQLQIEHAAAMNTGDLDDAIQSLL